MASHCSYWPNQWKKTGIVFAQARVRIPFGVVLSVSTKEEPEISISIAISD